MVVAHTRDHEELGFSVQNVTPKLAPQYIHCILAVVVKHNQAQKCLQSGQKHLQ